MTADQDSQDLLKRLEILEEENARLRATSAKEEANIIVMEGE